MLIELLSSPQGSDRHDGDAAHVDALTRGRFKAVFSCTGTGDKHRSIQRRDGDGKLLIGLIFRSCARHNLTFFAQENMDEEKSVMHHYGQDDESDSSSHDTPPTSPDESRAGKPAPIDTTAPGAPPKLDNIAPLSPFVAQMKNTNLNG